MLMMLILLWMFNNKLNLVCVWVTGSVGFKDALLGNQHWLEGTQLVVISNTQWVGENMPCLTYGMRGMIALSIEVSSLCSLSSLSSLCSLQHAAVLNATCESTRMSVGAVSQSCC